MEDQTAISRIKQGDPGGLELLVKRYQVKAVHAAYLILHDRSLAEEVAQTAFLRVVEKIHQFDDDRTFAPWFFKIVVNDAIKAAREKNRLTGLDEEAEGDPLTLAHWLMDPQPQPERYLEITESKQLIWAAMEQLNPEQRAVVVMRYFLEMSEVNMAAMLERPISTVKWWLRSARERLRIILRASRYFEDRE
jgi:RNA polymerase sigma-70 factor (ECF subfamily)